MGIERNPRSGGLDIGRDTLTAVSSRYEAPNPFTGSFDEVVFDLAPRPHRSGAEKLLPAG
jgi:hypothetical protein